MINKRSSQSLFDKLKKMKKFCFQLFAVLITLILIISGSIVEAGTTYYSRATGNWNATTTWSTVTYGNATNTGTYPVIGDMVFVGDGHTITIVSASACSGLTIGQGTSGIIEYPNFGSLTLNVSGTLNVKTGGQVRYIYNTTRTHNLFISGNIINNGVINLYADNNDVVNMVLNGAANSTISGTGTFNLNIVTISKATRTYFVEVQSPAFLVAAPPTTTAPRTDLIKGTFVFNTASTLTWSDPLATSYTIPMDVVIEVRTGDVSMLTNGDTLINSGKIYMSGGNLKIGSAAGTKGILNKVAGAITPEIELLSGTLTSTGGISSYPGGGNPWIFKLTSGNVDLNSGTTGTDLIPFYVENTSASQFLMTGGNIYIHKPSTTANTSEIDFGSSNVYHNVTGGHVYFGDATTAYNFDYMPYVSYSYPNFEVAGVAGTVLHPKSAIASKMLSIKVNPGNTFDVSTSASNATSTNISLLSTLDGTYALYNDGTFEERTGTLSFTGTAAQSIYAIPGEERLYNLTINNANGVFLDKPTSVGGSLTLTNGIVYSNAVNLLTFNAGASTVGASNISYVSGPVKKIGNTAFTFPVGAANMYRSFAISPPVSITDEFTSEYFFITPDPTYTRSSHAPSIDHISNMEYWTLSRNNGTSNVFVTLSWNSSSGGITNLPGLKVSQWDGAVWQDNGNGSTTGNTFAGTITSSAVTGSFGPFSLSSASPGINPLPVELSVFNVSSEKGINKLKWQTLSEKNSDYFDVERSKDGKQFETIDHVKAAGNSSTLLNYQVNDPFAGRSEICYRLKEVDVNGAFYYSETKCVNGTALSSITISPTLLSNENIKVDFGENSFTNVEINIIDITGKVIFNQHVNENKVTIKNEDVRFHDKGIYFIRMIADEKIIDTRKLVII